MVDHCTGEEEDYSVWRITVPERRRIIACGGSLPERRRIMAGGGSLSVLERRRRISQGPTGQSRVEIRGH